MVLRELIFGMGRGEGEIDGAFLATLLEKKI
jgi:hypothetical protein